LVSIALLDVTPMLAMAGLGGERGCGDGQRCAGEEKKLFHPCLLKLVPMNRL
jgi:hypothetical protein